MRDMSIKKTNKKQKILMKSKLSWKMKPLKLIHEEM